MADAGPLIALARTGHINPLSGLFERVLIPEAVREELQLNSGRPGARELRLALGRKTWLRVGKIRDQKALSSSLDAGENQAILLAIENKAPLLVDDLKGRKVAKAASLRVIGSGRVLVEAKRKELIPQVGPILDQFSDAGYRISPELARRLLELAGET